MASMSISGVVSGMDWESMIDEIITAAAKPAQVQVSKRTNLKNKKTLFEEMKVMVQAIQTSMTSLKLPSTYKAKAVDIERTDSSGSYKGVLTATVNADAEVNVHDIEVKQLATAQTNRSNQITASTIASTLSSGGVTGTSSTMYITAGGQRIGIDVYSTDSLQSLKSRINNTIKTLASPLDITASVVDNRLVIRSDYTGLGTKTVEGTVRGGYSSNGITSLTGLLTNSESTETFDIAVSEDNVENLKVMSGGTTYVNGTDYVVVNGTEIRWKQYDRGNEVALGDYVNARYTMAAGDVYTASGTVGDDEAMIFGFTMTDNGTLASRVKIVDEDGNTYTYGDDFTITNAKVSWLEKDTSAATNEPSSYTVSYSKDVAVSANISGTRSGTVLNVPADYTVSYTGGTVSKTYTASGAANGSSDSFSGTLADLKAQGFPIYDDGTYWVLDGYNREGMNITLDDGTTYEYGKDFVIWGNHGSNTALITGSKANNALKSYQNYKDCVDATFNFPTSGSYDLKVDYTPTYTTDYDTETPDKYCDTLSSVISAASGDYGNLTITSSDGTSYVYGSEFTITDGGIDWLVTGPLADDAISTADFSALETAYREAYSLGDDDDLPTITLTDSNGVLRTYLDPADRSLFTMEDSSGNTYTYGKDYVIQVNDSGDGWNVTWALSGTSSVANANKAVTAYMQAKGINTLGMKEAPGATDSYSLTFSRDVTVTDSGTVKSSDTDKSLATILEDISVDPADYSTAITIKNGSTTYTYGSDYTIDSDGNIEWLTRANLTEEPTSYTITYEGTEYTSISDILASDSEADLDNVIITLSDGSVCIQGTDYTIDDDGTINWIIHNQPNKGKSYTLYYEAFSAMEATADYTAGDETTALSDFSGVDLKYANIFTDISVSSKQGSSESDEDYQDRIDTALAKVFTLSDGTNTYEYGTDYRITADSDGMAVISWVDTGNIPDDGATLTMTYTGRGEGGGEVLSMPDAIQRSASDTINVNSSVTQPLYSNFSGGATRITNGTESFEEGTDFTVSSDALGYAVINWNTDKVTPPVYANNFDSTTSITAKDSDGNAITGFTISDDDGYASFSMDDGSVLDAGSYTVKVVKNGRTKIYDLTSDGSTMVLSQRSKWYSQDVSSTGTYTINVTKDGQLTTYTGTRQKNSYDFSISAASFDFEDGTNVITQGTKTFYEGVDFNITTDDSGVSTVDWIPDSEGGYEWYYPSVGSSYTITHTDSDGNTASFTGVRTSTNTLSLQDYGMTIANGALSVQYGDDTNYYNLEVDPIYETDEDGNYLLDEDGNRIISSESVTGNDVLKATHSFTIDKKAVWTGTAVDSSTNETNDNYSLNYTFNWKTPTLTSRSLPGYGSELTIEYEYDANTFSLEDDGDGLIDALGLNLEANVTEAHNAIISLNGEEVQRDSNYIGETYGNEISNLKGVTLQLKGLGTVSLDIYQDAEKAVEAITTFKDNYNDLMTWMNTRMTESQVDEDTAATIDSDDFRMRWGLLHGNSLLRQTKSTMRDLMAQSFNYTFTSRTSSGEIYGTLANNGLTNDATLRLRVGSTYMDLSLSPSHTLQDVVDMINDSTNVAMHNNFYDEDGNLREQPLIKASVSDDKLVISSTGSDGITISGTAAMNALKMNYTYKGLFQVGLATTSTDYGKSGELEFDESKFMEALEDNPDEVQELMLMFANQMDSWTKSMLTSSATGATKGTLSRQIDDIDTQIKSIDEYLEKYQERLDRQEESLRTKFAAAEQNIAQLSQQAASIASILSMLNNNTSNSNNSSSSAS